MKTPQDIRTLSTYNLLVQSPSLIVKNSNKKYTLNNIQTLYLYPLSIFDYINNLDNLDIIKLTFLSLDKDVDYDSLIINNFKNLKNVEFIIDDSYLDKIDILKKLINLLYKNDIKITLTINNLLRIGNLLKDYYEKITYFKIYMLNLINKDNESNFYKYLSIISNNSSGLINVKTYINIDEYLHYENTLKQLKKLNVDIFQVSKELIPLNGKNINLDSNIEKYIRMLEKKYYKFNTKFISVKDLSTLYYPRFELDERNKKKCYACLMKPYIDGKYIIPCKVNKIINNKIKYGINLNDISKYRNKVENMDYTCSDCASIFENDALGNICELSNDDFIKMELI